jgi:hypothetical protein
MYSLFGTTDDSQTDGSARKAQGEHKQRRRNDELLTKAKAAEAQSTLSSSSAACHCCSNTEQVNPPNVQTTRG